MGVINKEVVKRIAELAQLRLTDLEVDHYESQLAKILAYVEQLREVSDSQEFSEDRLFIENMRKDEVLPSLDIARTMAEAPRKIGSAFQVPRILE